MTPSTPEPVQTQHRKESLDVLRGVALLGILVLNIQSFAMPMAAYSNPTVYGDFSGANFWVWYISQLFFDFKFITIFSMLYGAGIMLMTERCADLPTSRKLLLSRSFWLLVFGMIHGYLIWSGDILVTYAITGALVIFARKWSIRKLLIAGIALLVFSVLIMAFFSYATPHMGAEQMAERKAFWSPPAEEIASELAAYRGSYWEQLVHRAPVTFYYQTWAFLAFLGWRTAGLMLVGMALLKSGFLYGHSTVRTYIWCLLPGILIGLPLIAWGLQGNLAAGHSWEYSMLFGRLPNTAGSLLLALTYVSLIIMACKRGWVRAITSSLAKVGQMAFTNYIMQTLICTTVFYGYGFGLFGHVERIGQILLVFGVWAVLFVISHYWLAHFRFGPLEWLWRSLSYRKRQSMRLTENSS